MKKTVSFLALAAFILGIGGGAVQAQTEECDKLIGEAQAQLAAASDDKKGEVEKLLKEARDAKAKGDMAACQASAGKAKEVAKGDSD